MPAETRNAPALPYLDTAAVWDVFITRYDGRVEVIGNRTLSSARLLAKGRSEADTDGVESVQITTAVYGS